MKNKVVNLRTDKYNFPMAEVHYDCYSEQFSEANDFYEKFDISIFNGETYLFDGLSYKDQARNARRLAKFLEKYANFIEKKNPKRDPNRK